MRALSSQGRRVPARISGGWGPLLGPALSNGALCWLVVGGSRPGLPRGLRGRLPRRMPAPAPLWPEPLLWAVGGELGLVCAEGGGHSSTPLALLLLTLSPPDPGPGPHQPVGPARAVAGAGMCPSPRAATTPPRACPNTLFATSTLPAGNHVPQTLWSPDRGPTLALGRGRESTPNSRMAFQTRNGSAGRKPGPSARHQAHVPQIPRASLPPPTLRK